LLPTGIGLLLNKRPQTCEGGAAGSIKGKQSCQTPPHSSSFPLLFHFGLMSVKGTKEVVATKADGARSSDDSSKHEPMFLQDEGIDDIYARKCDLSASKFLLLFLGR
jgi:hypothetical protein